MRSWREAAHSENLTYSPNQQLIEALAGESSARAGALDKQSSASGATGVVGKPVPRIKKTELTR
jgi:hypothetical protein